MDATEPCPTPPGHSDRWADASGAGTRTLPSKKPLTALCKRAAPRGAERATEAATMPLLDEEEAAMTPYASDDEAAAPAPAAPEVDDAERERRAKEEEERRRIEKQRLLKARAAEIVRKERMSKGDAAERFRETCRRSQEDLRRSRHSSVGSRPTTAPRGRPSDVRVAGRGPPRPAAAEMRRSFARLLWNTQER